MTLTLTPEKVRSYSPSRTKVASRTLLGGRIKADWRAALVARGYGWNVTVGTLSTGITGGGAGDVLDQDQPEFGLSVPKGFTLIPLKFRVQTRHPLVAADSDVTEILIAVDRVAEWPGDGTVTTETPLNLRCDGTGGCPARCFSAATGNITNPTLSFELARKETLADVQDAAAVATANVYQVELLYQPKHPPFIVGPACVYGYWGGTVAVVGYAQLNFAVIPSALVSALA